MNRLLANDCLGLFIDSEALKYGVTDMFFACPFAKGNLSHQFRLDPTHIAGNTGSLGKRVLIRSDVIQLRFQLAQCLIAESRADIAGVSQLFFFIIKAQQQRADPYPGTLWFGVAADDEFLPLTAFQFYSVRGAT